MTRRIVREVVRIGPGIGSAGRVRPALRWGLTTAGRRPLRADRYLAVFALFCFGFFGFLAFLSTRRSPHGSRSDLTSTIVANARWWVNLLDSTQRVLA